MRGRYRAESLSGGLLPGRLLRRCGHALDGCSGICISAFPNRFFSRTFKLRYIDELTRKAHQLEHESVLLGLYRGEMLPRPYYDLGDGDILPMTERAAKEIPKADHIRGYTRRAQVVIPDIRHVTTNIADRILKARHNATGVE